MSNLKEKAIIGVSWSAADAFLGQGITFIVGIILARLLSPEEYGLIGICLIFTTILNGIVDSGFSNAIIRKKNVLVEDYNTMFITNLIISVVLYIALFIASPLIADFFEKEELVLLLRTTGTILIINALSIVQTTNLSKRLDFKTKTKASIVSSLLSGIIGISLAFFHFGVWALAAQILSKQLSYTICLWFMNKWQPSLIINKTSFKYLWGFGYKLLLSGLLNNIWNQLYQIVVGKFYSPAILGQYTRSHQFAAIFSENITSIVQRVSYPVLSEIQDDKNRLINAYKRVIKTTMFITCSCMMLLAAISEPLIYCLIGPHWSETAKFLPLICVSMSLYPLHAINLNMLQVQGRSDIFLYLEIIKKIIAIGPILIGILYNIYNMLVASIITGIISFFLNSYYTGKKLGYTSLMQLKDIIPFYIISISIALPVFFLKILNITPLFILIFQLILYIVLFVLISEIFNIKEYTEIKGIIVNAIHFKRSK